MKHQPPPIWLLEAILVTLFCCFPLGIPAIVYGIKSRKKWKQGNITGAELDAQKARRLTTIGFFTGLIFAVLYIVFLVMLAKSV